MIGGLTLKRQSAIIPNKSVAGQVLIFDFILKCISTEKIFKVEDRVLSSTHSSIAITLNCLDQNQAAVKHAKELIQCITLYRPRSF